VAALGQIFAVISVISIRLSEILLSHRVKIKLEETAFKNAADFEGGRVRTQFLPIIVTSFLYIFYFINF
jgi:hypothetical protein